MHSPLFRGTCSAVALCACAHRLLLASSQWYEHLFGPEETISSASAEAVPQPPRKFQPGIPKLPPEVIRPQQPRLTHFTRNTEHERPATPVALRMVDLALDNLAKQDWFHPPPVQRLDGATPVYMASQQGHSDVVKTL